MMLVGWRLAARALSRPYKVRLISSAVVPLLNDRSSGLSSSKIGSRRSRWCKLRILSTSSAQLSGDNGNNVQKEQEQRHVVDVFNPTEVLVHAGVHFLSWIFDGQHFLPRYLVLVIGRDSSKRYPGVLLLLTDSTTDQDCIPSSRARVLHLKRWPNRGNIRTPRVRILCKCAYIAAMRSLKPSRICCCTVV